ncbi:uncharacterized protein LOC100284267 [Zea mays]|uniref:uncharacterized protein LOC100284267 n=1 Tax=Zea mays TaxID=4577 RepID=UPI000E29FA01|nr:uncharacterized protein LOC100284267 [Zea mays]
MQQHPVPQGGPGAEGAPLRLPELRPPGGRGQQLRVPERGAPQRRGVHPGAPGRGRRPHAAPHQVRALLLLRPRRGRLLPGHCERGGRDDALLRLLQPELRQPLERIMDGSSGATARTT